MKHVGYLLLAALLPAACKKDEKQHSVLYKVVVSSGHPTYSLSYSGNNNSTTSQGQITQTLWTSPAVTGRKAGTEVFFTLDGGTGGSYYMYIYIDGNLVKGDRLDDPYGPLTISAQIPDDN